MAPQPLLRPLARALPLLVLLIAAPNAVHAQSAASGIVSLPPEARARVAQAAADSRLAPWQRDVMLQLASMGPNSTPASPTPGFGAEGLNDGAWSSLVSQARYGHSAIYDPVRKRMVVLGGYAYPTTYFSDVWALSLAGTPAWTPLTPSGTPPSGRYYQSAIYDPVRDRIVIFGGRSGTSSLSDVWALSLAGTPAWTQLIPSGLPPSARYGHSAIYDPVRDRMVVLGGVTGSAYVGDAWALSLSGAPAWTQMTPSGTPPSARGFHSATYDPQRDCIVMFGGWTGSSVLDETWVMTLAGAPAWAPLAATGTPPNARGFHTAIYDAAHDCIMVFGGYTGTSYLNDVWALSLAGTPAWVPTATSVLMPSGRYSHSAIYDPGNHRMVVFAGYTGAEVGDLWALSLDGAANWARLTPGGTPPDAREFHSAIYDPVRDRMIVFGGYRGFYPYFNDVWALSLAGAPAWTLLSPTGTPPSVRYGQSMIYDPVRDRIVVFGGYSASYLSDVWALSLAGSPAWTQLSPTGSTFPRPRYAHTAIYDPVRDRMLVFGGEGGPTFPYLNDVWSLSLAGTPAWTQVTPTGTPPAAREFHSAIYDPVRDRMVVFAGSSASFAYLNDLWGLSLAGSPAWSSVIPFGTLPSVRHYHSAIYDPVRDRMVAFGGWHSGSWLGDTWELALTSGPVWTKMFPQGNAPKPRRGHSAIYDPKRDRMVAFGGYASPGEMNDTWSLWWSGVSVAVDPTQPPLLSGLRPPVPNPARGTTALSYAIARAGHVELGIYDVSGRLVRHLVDGERRAGSETVVWNGTAESGTRLGSGVYFARLVAPGIRETRRVVLLR